MILRSKNHDIWIIKSVVLRYIY